MGGGNPISQVTNTVKSAVGGRIGDITKNPLSILPTVQLGNMIKGGGVLGSSTGNILNDLTGKNATDAALAAQMAGMESANTALAGTYGQQQQYLNPYAQSGTTALETLTKGNIVDPTQIANNPAYQFRMSEGLKGVNSNAAARGMLNSGATMKALTRYSQGLASTEYDNAYNREAQRLNNLAGMGQNAANNLSNAAGSYGANLSNNYIGRGNAQAAAAQQGYNNMMNLANMGIQGAAMFSDERLKTNITEVDPKDLAEMRKHLKAYAWNYKKAQHGKGDWVGVMAQDLQKSKLGKTLVITNSKGELTIDQNKVLSMFLALMAQGY